LASDSSQPYSVTATVKVTYTNDEGDESEITSVFHYTSLKSAEGIANSGELIVPSESTGNVYVTPSLYQTAAEAQSALAMQNTPDGYYQIPLSRIPGISAFRTVDPAGGWPGGGIEATTPDSVDVGGIEFDPFIG
jgi:hypothetical protein